MYPVSQDWTEEEIKTFNEARDELDCSSSDWFEKLLSKFPNKKAEDIMDRYMGFTSNSRKSPIHVQEDPQVMNFASETEKMLEPDCNSVLPGSGPTSVKEKARHENEKEIALEQSPGIRKEAIVERGKSVVTETNSTGTKRKLVQMQETSKASKGKPCTEEEHRLKDSKKRRLEEQSQKLCSNKNSFANC